MITLYGIANCDTVRKARAWLAGSGLAYTFHDWRKAGVDPAMLRRWVEAEGWERILNTRGTTFRKLPEGDRVGLDASRALAIMHQHPSAIRRPLVAFALAGRQGLLVGFDEQAWGEALKAS